MHCIRICCLPYIVALCIESSLFLFGLHIKGVELRRMSLLAASTKFLIHSLHNLSSLFFSNIALAATLNFFILRFPLSIHEQVCTNMSPALTRPHLALNLILRQKPHLLPLLLSLSRDLLIFIPISHTLLQVGEHVIFLLILTPSYSLTRLRLRRGPSIEAFVRAI